MNPSSNNGTPTASATSTVSEQDQQRWLAFPEYVLLDRLVATKFLIYSTLSDELLNLAREDLHDISEELLGGVLAPEAEHQVERLAYLFAWWVSIPKGLEPDEAAYQVSQAMKYDLNILGSSLGADIGISERDYYAEVAMRLNRVGLPIWGSRRAGGIRRQLGLNRMFDHLNEVVS